MTTFTAYRRTYIHHAPRPRVDVFSETTPDVDVDYTVFRQPADSWQHLVFIEPPDVD